MNLNDYVHYMFQKYRLAIAIGVLKSKPTELTVNQYVDKLKDKLNDKMDIDVVSINSNDFNFDEEVFNEFNDSFNENDNSCNENNHSATVLGDFDMHKTNDSVESCDVDRRKIANVLDVLRHEKHQHPSLLSTQNFTQNTFYEESEYKAQKNDHNSALNLPKANAIHKEIPYEANFNKTGDIQDITTTNKIRNSEMANKIAKNISKQIQNTRNDTIDDENGRKIDNNNKTTVNNTIFKNNDANDMNLDRNDITMEETQNLYTKDVNEKILANVRKNIRKEIESDTQRTYYNEKEEKIANIQNYNSNTKESSINKNNCENNTIDTQKTIIYTLYDIADNNTHISQSQFDNIEIRDSLVYGNRNHRILNKCGGNLQNICEQNVNSINKKDFEINSKDRQRIEDNTNGSQEIIGNYNIQRLENELHTNIQVQNENNVQNEKTQIQKENKIAMTQIQSTEIEYIIDRNGKKYKVMQNNPTNKNRSEEYSYNWSSIQDPNSNDTIREPEIDKNTDNSTNLQSKDQCTEIHDDGNINNEYNNIEEIHNSSNSELIPFKVVEELNKVKRYLNQRQDKKEDVYLTDSGYRSDSHSRSSYKSVQMSDNWLNQSAYSLYAHLTQCPLVDATEDITKEISQIIGELIDMLHEDEKYPSFLEDILQNIQSLLEDIFNSNGISEDLLKKEEKFQRLCLLNRSIHTLRFTLGKVTELLEKVHTNLTHTDNLYEIMNIEEVENLTYIFHIIEILVPKYMKLKLNTNLSQTQSQEDKLLKKSSITEIWRKKWNPDFKEITQSEGRCEKKCILAELAEILNKIVVNCFEGYSLVAFAALQCYNLMQK